MTNIIRPRCATIRLASKWITLSSSLWRPRTTKAGGRKRAEVPPVGTDGLDDHEVFALAFDGVDLDCFEEVVGCVAEDDGGRGAEVSGEVADGHGGSVDFAVVTGEEEIHGCAVADDGLVDGAGAGAGDGAGEERLCG